MVHYEMLSGESFEKLERNSDSASITHLWCKEMWALGIDFTSNVDIIWCYRIPMAWVSYLFVRKTIQRIGGNKNFGRFGGDSLDLLHNLTKSDRPTPELILQRLLCVQRIRWESESGGHFCLQLLQFRWGCHTAGQHPGNESLDVETISRVLCVLTMAAGFLLA